MSIYIVGIGPGDKKYMTYEALDAIKKCDVIVGYSTYIHIIEDLISGKKVISNGMKKEVERGKIAIKEAKLGKNVGVISSGDAGIYGMAGLIYELSESENIEIIVVPGITAAISAASILGAPLMNDFAVISLSDLLTSWEIIVKRIEYASKGDFSIAIYNPSSIKRHDYLEKACNIMKLYKSIDTPCGLVRNAGRDGCSYEICTLDELTSKNVDMFTTVIIGNSQTVIINNKLVTKRGYEFERSTK